MFGSMILGWGMLRMRCLWDAAGEGPVKVGMRFVVHERGWEGCGNSSTQDQLKLWKRSLKEKAKDSVTENPLSRHILGRKKLRKWIEQGGIQKERESQKPEREVSTVPNATGPDVRERLKAAQIIWWLRGSWWPGWGPFRRQSEAAEKVQFSH